MASSVGGMQVGSVVLDQLSLYLSVTSRASASRTTYPAIILVMAIVTVVILVGFVMPRFTAFFKEFDAKLPLPTQMLLDFSDFTQQWWFAIIGVAGALIIGGALFLRTDTGMRTKDKFFLRLPLVGDVVQYASSRRFCRIITDDEGRCADAGGDAGGHRRREQQGLRGRAHPGARADARG
jgi:type II secretory pathway component PulF